MNIKLPKVLGTEDFVQLKTGKKARVVLLNNAATTPPFEITLNKVSEFLQTYGALHRGAGPHAQTTFDKVDQALKVIRQFLNIGENQTLLFTSNTSSAINWLARAVRLKPDDVVITSEIEHTSNNLPWRFNTPAKNIYAKAFIDGALDYEDLEQKIKHCSAQLKIVAITGASNLSGYIPDIKRISDLAHEQNALLFVDAAQLAPHRPINMQAEGIDALAFSAHKIYAPFGLGVLVLPKKLLNSIPVDPGGGSIDMISEEEILWAGPEVRHQTGTWNTTGIIALAASCQAILDAGWDNILSHERDLVNYAAQELDKVAGLSVYVSKEKYLQEDRIGTFVFNLPGYHHALLSAILEHEFGIETRAGTICNHRLVRRWFGINDSTQKEIEQKISQGDRLASYGVVRASLGIHNTLEDIDILVSALRALNKCQLSYKPVPAEETFILEDEATANHPNFLNIESLAKSYNQAGRKLVIFKNLDIKMIPGEFLAIFGPNGSGKTTLLNLIAGLDKSDQGAIVSEKKNLKIAYIFQNYRGSLFPWLTVKDNIAYPLKLSGIEKSQRHKEVLNICEEFKVKLDLESYLYSLSGGQQQLVTILRALITKPDLILIDEPFSSLDYQTRLFMIEKTQEIWLKTGIGIIFVSHDIDEAILLCQRLVLFGNKPTKIVKDIKNAMPYPRDSRVMGSQQFGQIKQEILNEFIQQLNYFP